MRLRILLPFSHAILDDENSIVVKDGNVFVVTDKRA